MQLCFAPMDGITNCTTRLITQQIFDKYGNTEDNLTVRTEFMNVDGFLINPHQVIKHILTSEGQKPIVQVYGGKRESLVRAVEIIQNEYSQLFSGIELNTGCPSNTVMKVGGGSDMLRNKEETLMIIKEISEIKGDLPFSLKTRAGLNDQDKEEQLKFLLKASSHCSKISIHGRTLKQLYNGQADRNFISKIKIEIEKNGNSECEIIGNGGITSYQESQDKISEFGLDGIMIGQAAIGNPRIFTNYSPDMREKCEIILKHLDYSVACDQWFDEFVLSKKDSGDKILKEDLYIKKDWLENRCLENLKKSDFQPHAIVEFRKFLFQYVKGISGSKERKQSVLSCKGYQELRNQIIKFLNF